MPENLSGSSSRRKDLAEQEKQLLGSFWKYVQPMNLYKLLQQRHEISATYLRRNLTYHQQHAAAPCDRLLEVCLHTLAQSDEVASPVFAVIVKKVKHTAGAKSEQAFQSLAAHMLNAPVTGQAVTARLPLPAGQQLGVLIMTSGDPIVANMIALKQKRLRHSAAATMPVSIDCSKMKALGLIPVGSRVNWCYTKISSRIDDAPKAIVVCLARGRVYTAASSTGFQLQLTTKHKSSQVPSFQMQLRLLKAAALSQLADNKHTIKPEVLHQQSTPSQALPHSPVSPSPQSGYLLPSTFGSPQPPPVSPVQPSEPLNHVLSSPCSPLLPPQASVGNPLSRPSPSRSRQAANGCSQTNAESGCDNRKGSGAVHSNVNPSGTVYFSHCLHEKRHITEATSGFTCFACKQRCKGLLGLQQHIHACHNLFDFHCLQSSLKSGIPTILSRCPPDLIDSHGNLCCLESQAMAWTDHLLGHGSVFHCSPSVRKLRMEQYELSEQVLAKLPSSLTSNPFSKAAWRKQYASAKITVTSPANKKRKATKQPSVISPRAYRPPRHIPPASPSLTHNPPSPSQPPRHFTAGASRSPTDPNQAGLSLPHAPPSRPVAISPAFAATAAAVAACKQAKHPKSPPPDLIQLNFPEVATSRGHDNATSRGKDNVTSRDHDPAANPGQICASQSQHLSAPSQATAAATEPVEPLAVAQEGQVHVVDPLQGPVAVFSSKAAAAIAAARMRQADSTRLASAPAGAHSPAQQQQDPSKAVGQRTIVPQKPNVSFGGRSQQADWSQSAVVLPRPCSAAAPQQRPKASHARTAASRSQSAHVSAAVGSSHQHRALSTTAALPKPRSTAAAAAAASSSGKASIGLAASGNVTLRAASASSIHGTALSKQTALPPHSNAVRSDLHQRAVQSHARSRPQVQSLSQLSLPSRKRSRPLSAASSSHLNQPVYFHARSHVRMTNAEVAQIMEDPACVPDSDDDEDHQAWKARVIHQLDLQSDLNSAEKNFMLHWNVFLHENPCLSDAHMGQRCLDFAAAQAAVFAADPDLRRCFMVHLVNLWEFNLIDTALIDKCIVAASMADRPDVCLL